MESWFLCRGFLNLLMTLIMSGVTFLASKTVSVLCIQIMGIIFLLIIAFLSVKIAMLIFNNSFGSLIFPIYLFTFAGILFYYPLAFWSLMGMETGLLTTLFLITLYLTLGFIKKGNQRVLPLIAVFTGMMFLTRNESIIFAGLIWGGICWKVWKKYSQRNFYLLILSFGIIFIFIGGQLTFQYLYYGAFLPNTYNLKLTGLPLKARISDGISFIKPFVLGSWFPLLLILIDLFLNFKKIKVYLLSFYLTVLIYQVYIGGDAWNYWRIPAPSMPLVILLFTGGAAGIFVKIFTFIRLESKLKLTLQGVIITGLIITCYLQINKYFLDQIYFKSRPYKVINNEYNVNTALLINRLTTKEATIGVFWGGSIPYYTGRKAIDFLGKSDKHIANLPADNSGVISWYGMNSVPGHNKYDLNYSIKQLQPTYIQVSKWGSQDLTDWVNENYSTVYEDGITLLLKKNSPYVRWEEINRTSNK